MACFPSRGQHSSLVIPDAQILGTYSKFQDGVERQNPETISGAAQLWEAEEALGECVLPTQAWPHQGPDVSEPWEWQSLPQVGLRGMTKPSLDPSKRVEWNR